MSDPVEDIGKMFGWVVVAGFALTLAIAAIFILPALALAAVPVGAAYVWYIKFRDDPNRAEAAKQKELWGAYERTKEGTLGALDEATIQAGLHEFLPADLDEEVSFHLRALGRVLLDELDLGTDLAPPPTVANSIEGGKYLDRLTKIGTRNPQYVKEAVKQVARLIGYAANVAHRHSGSSKIPAKYFLPHIGATVQVLIDHIFEHEVFDPFRARLEYNLEANDNVFPSDYDGADAFERYFAGSRLAILFAFDVPFSLPAEQRGMHHHILANSGSGKTHLLYSMVIDDMERDDCAIVVIDSSRDTIENLSRRVDPERLILIDPVHCPPALNLFAPPVKGDQAEADALDLFEYIFSSLEAELTSMQQLVYRNLSRLCMVVPGANLATLRDMCELGGTLSYGEHIAKLSDNSQKWFAEFEEKKSQYDGTRGQVRRRLFQVLDNPVFNRMLDVKTMRLNVAEALDSGKIILVNTDLTLLKGEAKLLGRIMIALVMQAVQSRPQGDRKRVYMYIDEFADYASDVMMPVIFSGTRKYNLGMIVCHQSLGQLAKTPLLSDAIVTNTAIRFGAGVSPNDLTARAAQMNTDVATLKNLPKYTFLAYIKDVATLPWKVEADPLRRVPPRTNDEMAKVYQTMRERYGEPKEAPAAKPKRAPKAKNTSPLPEDPNDDGWSTETQK